MHHPKEKLTFSPNSNACHICGKTLDQFMTDYGFSSHQQEIDLKHQSTVLTVNSEIEKYYSEFVDYFKPKFNEFYDRLMKLPSAMDNLKFLDLKTREKQQTFEKMFPEIRGFNYVDLKTWGIGSSSSRGRHDGNLGNFKEFCKEVHEDFENKVLNKGIIAIVNQMYIDYDGYPVNKPSFLDPLNEDLRTLDESRQEIMPKVTFSQKEFTYEINSISYTFIYYLCPICCHICKVI